MNTYKHLILSLSIFFLLGSPQTLFAQETIQSFDADIVINKDASVDIVETIIYDFGMDQRHGIFRTIPIKYKTDAGNTRSIRVDDIRVVNENGKEHTFVESKEGRDLKVKIGDADRYVDGVHTYRIFYTVYGAMNYFDEHDELYWNVTDDEWEVPLQNARVETRAPKVGKAICYVGIFGSTTLCDKESVSDTASHFEQNNIQPGENMTVVTSIPKGYIYQMSFLEHILWFLQDNGIYVVLPMIIIGGLYTFWWRFGRDPKGSGTIVPWFKAPEGLSPAEMGVVIDESFDKQDLSALIIDLAVRGHLTIKQIGEAKFFSSSVDYQFKKMPSQDPLLSFEKYFLDNFFIGATNREILLSEKKLTFKKDFQKIGNDISERLTPLYFVKNPTKVAKQYAGVGFGVLFVLHTLGIIIGSPIISLFGWVIGLALVFGLGRIMSKRTPAGVAALEHIKGLKMYLGTAEKRRLEFHNAPEKNAEQFEKLLPAAVALGVVKEWGEQFEGLLDHEPEWFNGGNSAFNAAHFGSSLTQFSSASGSALSTSPSSSSSGGSGFSGGGSGGGMGGGGGGSW